MRFSPVILKRQAPSNMVCKKWEEDDGSNFASLLLTFVTPLLFGRKELCYNSDVLAVCEQLHL